MSEYSGSDQQPYAQQTTTKGPTQSKLDMSQVAFSSAPNYEGMPTEYYDKNGQLIGYLANDNNVMSTAGLNFVNPDGTPSSGAINKHSLYQATDENGNLLFNPTADTQAGESPVYSTQDQGRGAVAQQLAGLIKMNAPSPGIFQDPLFRNFGLSALAMAGGAALAPELAGAGAGAEAFPVALGDSITMSPLTGSVAGLGTGSLTEGLTPAMIAAQEAALPANMAQIGGLASGAGGAGALTAAQALQYAKLGLSGLGLANQLVNSAGGQGGGQGGSGQGNTTNNTTAVSQNGPWNTFLHPTEIKQDVVSQKPIMQNPELAKLYQSLDPYLANQLAQSGLIPSNLGGGQQQPVQPQAPTQSYFTYGSPAQTTQPTSIEAPMRAFANGGSVLGSFMDGGQEHVPEFITGATGHYVKGRGDGQADLIPAMLASGEYVWDSDIVSALGNGDSDSGAKVLDGMRQAIRAHKRSAPLSDIPPKAKSPLQYMKDAEKYIQRDK